MPVARLPAGKRALIIGKTESGKTHLVQTGLSAVNSWVVIDSKRSPKPHEPAAWAQRLGVPVSADPADILRHRRLVYQVSERSLRDRAGWYRPGTWGWLWTVALRCLKRRGATVVDFNEGLQTLPSNGSHPEAREVFTQGAAFDLSAWVETQASNWIDTIMLRQADILISFRCAVQQDRDIIGKARGVDASVLGQLARYWWAYHDIADDELTVFPPLPAPPRVRMRPDNVARRVDAAAPAQLDTERETRDDAHERPDVVEPTMGA